MAGRKTSFILVADTKTFLSAGCWLISFSLVYSRKAIFKDLGFKTLNEGNFDKAY